MASGATAQIKKPDQHSAKIDERLRKAIKRSTAEIKPEKGLIDIVRETLFQKK